VERSFFAKALAIRHCGMAVMWVKHGKTMSSTTTCLMVYSTHKNGDVGDGL
jgi:hydrogenase maturation factor HypF (carbamoyltransferase family)